MITFSHRRSVTRRIDDCMMCVHLQCLVSVCVCVCMATLCSLAKADAGARAQAACTYNACMRINWIRVRIIVVRCPRR